MINMLKKGEIKLPAKVVRAKAKQTIIGTSQSNLHSIANLNMARVKGNGTQEEHFF